PAAAIAAAATARARASVLPASMSCRHHPVYFGFVVDVLLGCAVTKCVEATIAFTSGIGFPWSNAVAAGVTPARNRIQAACRASTEWIEIAAARSWGDLIRAACAL